MNRSLIKKLWKLGDKQFIDYALSCARLTLRERETVQYLLFDGLTQEQAAEKMNISTRGLQGLWSCAVEKILLVPGTIPYINSL
nr:MAG TPA: putative DNA-binding protein [Caudoviricetes sp.]